MASQAEQPLNENARKRLLEEFENSLGEDRGIDAADRDTLLSYFRDALEHGGAAPGAVAHGTVGPDRRAWTETLELLRQNQILSAQDCSELSQQFDQAMLGLQSDTLRRASEFAQRTAHDGDDSAREWLKQDLGRSSQTDRQPEGVPAHVANALRRRR
jgi:hypothetical protein